MNNTNSLLNFIKYATSPFHAVKQSISILKEHGFQSLDLDSAWTLKNGGRYYTAAYDSTLIAFVIGERLDDTPMLRIAAAHTDFPCFKVKPNASIIEKNYVTLNTETYGGAILNSWFDRPLSIAGKVALKSDSVFHPHIRFIDFNQNLLTIPNLAIHMNRDINKGKEINKQTELLPLLSSLNDTLKKDDFFLHYLADKMNVDVTDILDYDFYIYNKEEGCMLGINQAFISAPRLDNLTSVYGLLNGIIQPELNPTVLHCIALYDNEEVGSHTKQGADSMIMNFILEKIFHSLDKPKTALFDSITKSLLLSADVAHGYHPNYSAKCDPTNKPCLNQGVVLKINASQKYASDTEAIAIVQQLCDKHHIPYQKYVNRSDIAGGSTLGSITSSWLPMKTVDLGIPLLAMHSARELMGANDQNALNKLIQVFFQE